VTRVGCRGSRGILQRQPRSSCPLGPDTQREIANVTVRSAVYVDYLHLVRTREGWRIINALWQHP
jgi:hypothetical protein